MKKPCCENCKKKTGFLYVLSLEDEVTGKPTGETVTVCESCLDPVIVH